MTPARVCRRCAEHYRITGLGIFDRYAKPGVCDWCQRSALVCYCEGPQPATVFSR